MASAQIQQFYDTTKTTTTNTTRRKKLSTSYQHTDISTKTTTTAKNTTTLSKRKKTLTTTTTTKSQGIFFINRKQFAQHLQPKTQLNSSRSSANSCSDFFNTKNTTTTTKTLSIPADIIRCQTKSSYQHTIITENDSSTKSVPPTTTTTKQATFTTTTTTTTQPHACKSFTPSTDSATVIQTTSIDSQAKNTSISKPDPKWTNNQQSQASATADVPAAIAEHETESKKADQFSATATSNCWVGGRKSTHVEPTGAADAVLDVDSKILSLFNSAWSTAEEVAGRTDMSSFHFPCKATTETAGPSKHYECLNNGTVATEGQGAETESNIEKTGVAIDEYETKEIKENVNVNNKVASSFCNDGCARGKCSANNIAFTGTHKQIIAEIQSSDQKNIAHFTNNTTTTTSCCQGIQPKNATNNVAKTSCFPENAKPKLKLKMLENAERIPFQRQMLQSTQQKQQNPHESRLSSIDAAKRATSDSSTSSDAAATFLNRHCNATQNAFKSDQQLHVAAAETPLELLPVQQCSAKQRMLQTNYSHNHTNSKTNKHEEVHNQLKEDDALPGGERNNIASFPHSRCSGGDKTGASYALGHFCASTFNFFVDIQKFASTILPLFIILNMLPLFYAECDQTFVSRIGGPQNGTFSAPLLYNQKNYSKQCLFTFLAGPGQRVEVVFTSFNLRGSPPDGSAVGELPTCVHEYMDIYSEVQSSDPAELINSPFGGRYCGSIPPRRRISMYRAIAISFFTNKNVSAANLFEGNYRFINASEYEIGIPIAGSPCSYTITPSMSINKTGVLISPTYPGAYPKDMSCTYQFLGESNQRVRLEFRDFDLFFGGPHCPFDYVKVYDGPDNSSALIGTYCGQQRNLVLYSSESSLFVHFYTLPRTANTQNRGFKGIYEFSESFVKLDFIRENDGIHIRGSECDQKILSKKESTGFVLSPNYPYPYIPKTVCRYFIYGMQDAQHLERVRLEFSSFNIPKVEHKDKSESNCSDGYLKIYLKGQETADAYDKFDYELCGNETQRVVSDGPRLAMVFSSGELQGRGFKGKYTFETEYKIPGTAAPDGTCSFTYVSSSKKRGELNSPRYPSNYPSATNCSYLFLAEPNEQVTIVFDHFKVKADGHTNTTAGAYGSAACFEDWLEMYLVYRDNNDRFLGRYCGLTAPGPVESPRGAVGLRITLHTDQENVASGFKARYFFEAAKSDVGDCGGNFSNEDSGIITSPNYPSPYKAPGKGMASMACNWVMTARPGYKLSINFEQFSIEGDPANRGCPAAVLRLWVNVDSDQPPLELCGEKPPHEQWHYISTGQTARISFTTSDKTVGAQGFRIVWTEIQDSGPGPPSIGLLCESTYHFQCEVGYCISDKLRCDGVKNCGPGDDSDELHCESYNGSARGGSRRSNYNNTGRRLVPNLSPMHTLSLQKKT